MLEGAVLGNLEFCQLKNFLSLKYSYIKCCHSYKTGIKSACVNFSLNFKNS